MSKERLDDLAVVTLEASNEILGVMRRLVAASGEGAAMVALAGTCGRALAITGMSLEKFVSLVKSNLEHQVNDDVRKARPS